MYLFPPLMLSLPSTWCMVIYMETNTLQIALEENVDGDWELTTQPVGPSINIGNPANLQELDRGDYEYDDNAPATTCAVPGCDNPTLWGWQINEDSYGQETEGPMWQETYRTETAANICDDCGFEIDQLAVNIKVAVDDTDLNQLQAAIDNLEGTE